MKCALFALMCLSLSLWHEMAKFINELVLFSEMNSHVQNETFLK